MPRPTKLTQQSKNRIFDLVRRGLPWVHISNLLGIGESTLRTWKATNKAFRTGCARAASEAVEARLALIGNAAIEDWRAARWLLSVSDPANFSERTHAQVEVSQAPAAAPVVTLSSGEWSAFSRTGKLPKSKAPGLALVLPANGFERESSG